MIRNIYLCDIIINNPPTTSNWFKDYGSIIGSSITIILFIAGFIINKLIEKNKEKKRLLEIENYFKTLIHLLRKPLIKQCDALVNFSHILKNKKDLRFDFKDVSDFHVEEIKRIDDKDLFIIFIKNKNEQMLLKTELYSKIKSSIDYINRTKHSIPKDLKDFGERFEIHQKEYNLNLETIEDIFRLHHNENEFIESHLFFIEMSKIREEWANPKNNQDYKHTDKYIAITKFVEPLQLLCEKHISEQIPKQIFKHVMLCNYAYDNIIEVKKVYRDIFINQARGLLKKLFELDETIKKIDSIPQKTTKIMQPFIKLTLSILFLLCLLHLPYGYYELIRFCALLGFALLAYFSFQNKQNTITIIYIGLAILFQPIFKIALGRTIWNIVDVIVAIGLICSIFYNWRKNKKLS